LKKKKEENENNGYDDDEKKIEKRQRKKPYHVSRYVIDKQTNRQKRMRKISSQNMKRHFYTRFKAMNDEEQKWRRDNKYYPLI
jgi:hypothetical protein